MGPSSLASPEASSMLAMAGSSRAQARQSGLPPAAQSAGYPDLAGSSSHNYPLINLDTISIPSAGPVQARAAMHASLPACLPARDLLHVFEAAPVRQLRSSSTLDCSA